LTLVWIFFAVLAGWDYHQGFFVTLRWSWQTQYNYVTSKKADYTYFGFGAMFLNMIPLANFIFPFVMFTFNNKKKIAMKSNSRCASQTNNVGAAIWAANLAKEMQIAAEQQQQQQQQPGGGEAAKLAPVKTTV
jgi:hypothetical protein